LPAMARAAAKRAHGFARAEQERARAQRQPGGWPRRVAAAVAAVFMFLWVWLSSIPARARGEDKPAADAGVDAGVGAGRRAPERWEPWLPATPAGSAHTPAPKAT